MVGPPGFAAPELNPRIRKSGNAERDQVKIEEATCLSYGVVCAHARIYTESGAANKAGAC